MIFTFICVRHPTSLKSSMIKCIFRILGTPTNETWSGVEDLPEYKSAFPKWKPKDVANLLPNLEPAGIDLLKVHIYIYPITLQNGTPRLREHAPLRV